MTDLDVKPKRTGLWLWMLLILIAASVLYFFLIKEDHKIHGKEVADTANMP